MAPQTKEENLTKAVTQHPGLDPSLWLGARQSRSHYP